MKPRSIVRVLAAGLMSLSGVTGVAMAADVTLKFAHEAPETAVKGMTANKFAELVAEYSDGSIQVDVFPGGQLVPTEEEIRAAARGQVDFIAPFTSYYSSLDESWDIFYQPMLFGSPEEAMEVFAGSVGEQVLGNLESRGLIGMAIWHDGPVYVFTNEGAVHEPDDLRGKKIRVFPSEPLESMLTKLGAAPVSMPATEVYLALQQGVVDGVLTTPTYVAPAKWHEVLSGMTKAMMGVGGYGVAVSKRTWGELSAEHREIVRRAMADATAWNQERALAHIRDSEDLLAERGMEVVEPSEELTSVYQDYAAEVYTEQGEVIADLVKQVRDSDSAQ